MADITIDGSTSNEIARAVKCIAFSRTDPLFGYVVKDADGSTSEVPIQ